MKLFCSSGLIWKLFRGTRKTTKMSCFWQKKNPFSCYDRLFFPLFFFFSSRTHWTEAAMKGSYFSFYNLAPLVSLVFFQHAKHKEGLQFWFHQRCIWGAASPSSPVGQQQPPTGCAACPPLCPGSCHASTYSTQHTGPAGGSLPQASWGVQATETTVTSHRLGCQSRRVPHWAAALMSAKSNPVPVEERLDWIFWNRPVKATDCLTKASANRIFSNSLLCCSGQKCRVRLNV